MHNTKNEIRKKFLTLRSASRKQKQVIVQAKEFLKELTRKEKNCLIGVYFSTEQEISTLPLMKWLNDISIPYALPRIISYLHHEMAFFPPSKIMTINKLGIYEPEQSTEVEPTIIIVPVVVSDLYGNRLGSGHGYYDRYLLKLKSINPQLIAIGLCYEFQIHEGQLPIEPHDQPLNYIITESHVYNCT